MKFHEISHRFREFQISSIDFSEFFWHLKVFSESLYILPFPKHCGEIPAKTTKIPQKIAKFIEKRGGKTLFITPKMLGLLFKASYSIFIMCAESSSLAPAPADGAPIHRERGVAMPLNRQLCTFGLTCHRASRVGHTSFRYHDLCLVSKRRPPIAIVHARINAMERHLAAPRLQCAAMP